MSCSAPQQKEAESILDQAWLLRGISYGLLNTSWPVKLSWNMLCSTSCCRGWTQNLRKMARSFGSQRTVVLNWRTTVGIREVLCGLHRSPNLPLTWIIKYVIYNSTMILVSRYKNNLWHFFLQLYLGQSTKVMKPTITIMYCFVPFVLVLFSCRMVMNYGPTKSRFEVECEVACGPIRRTDFKTDLNT